jgi:hypothetical protein
MDEVALSSISTDERVASALETLAADTKKLRVLMERQTGLEVLDHGNGEVYVSRVDAGKLRPRSKENDSVGR